MAKQIEGSQRDFSFGEVDADLKRSDDHPARKAGLRQMANLRIHNSKTVQNRPGRSALYPITNNGLRTERFVISPGNAFDIQFAAGRVKIINAAGATVANFTLQGNGAALPWVTAADIRVIVYAIVKLTITITFGHAMRPQVITWDGVATWSIADFTELVVGNQKRTPFYRISPQNITLLPSGVSGAITLIASAPLFTAAWVGTRVRYIGRQILITGFTDSMHVNATVQEVLPGSQKIDFATNPNTVFNIGDEVIGGVTQSKGIVISFPTGTSIQVQLLSTQTSTVTSLPTRFQEASTTVFAFQLGDGIVGPGGTLVGTVFGAIDIPRAVSVWDEEVMNDFRGYPASCFADQFRLGFTNFSSVPEGIGWSGINNPTNLYPGPNPADPMFETAPDKVQVYFVVAGPEGSEFVFCDRGVFYIPISETNPLKPGSVAFKRLSGDGAAQVRPRLAQEAIIYVNAGGNSMMAVIATGAYQRPFNTRSLTDFHAHLFDSIQCIAAPGADGTFNERYCYVLNGDGSIAVGKYDASSLASSEVPVIGWGPWSGGGAVSWIAASAADVLFTSSYFGTGVVEILDDNQYLDCALSVNAAPAAFAPPGGKGPLWFIPGQSVTLMDQVTRDMGIYQIDANGFIVPQFNGGENLAIASLVAGQPWTWIAEPFAVGAAAGADQHQRMIRRRISRFSANVIHSTGLLMARLFSSKQTTTSPALGTVMNFTRFPAYNIDDDATKPPPQRETMARIRPPGWSFDPRVAVIGDTPGPVQIMEIGMEISL